MTTLSPPAPAKAARPKPAKGAEPLLGHGRNIRKTVFVLLTLAIYLTLCMFWQYLLTGSWRSGLDLAPRTFVEAFKAAAERLGDRGEPTIFTTSSGFTELVKNWAGLLDTFYLLTDYPAAVEAFLEACDRRDDRVIDAALELPCRIYNLGDHATDEFTPPPICKKYMMPRWQRLSERLHAEGRFVHSHWDGHSHTILPFLMDSGLDSVEALTPVPMGNITLEEIKVAVGDKLVVLDLLPAIHFLPSYTTEELLEFTRKVIDMFAPRLILGVSDEISYNGQIEKIEAVTELVDSICGLPEQ